jgi:hypothetical protein
MRLSRRPARPRLHARSSQPERQAEDHQEDDLRRALDRHGWPPTSYTNKLKVQGIEDYGFKDKTLGHYEEDHLIPLAVGGSPRSPKNLWPERYSGKFGARVKDKLEWYMHDRVCDGTIRLSKARRAFRNWKTSFTKYGL